MSWKIESVMMPWYLNCMIPFYETPIHIAFITWFIIILLPITFLTLRSAEPMCNEIFALYFLWFVQLSPGILYSFITHLDTSWPSKLIFACPDDFYQHTASLSSGGHSQLSVNFDSFNWTGKWYLIFHSYPVKQNKAELKMGGPWSVKFFVYRSKNKNIFFGEGG